MRIVINNLNSSSKICISRHKIKFRIAQKSISIISKNKEVVRAQFNKEEDKLEVIMQE